MGGDGDTIQAASYYWGDEAEFDVVGLSVYRQAVDLADIEHAGFVIPGGVSGVPGTPHFADQLEPWRRHRRIPMHYAPADVAGAAAHTLTLTPA
jgi:penicillin amidase